MSHSPKSPPLAKATADLPDVEDGVLAYDTTQGKPVARLAGVWSEIAGEVFGTPTVVYDDGAGIGNTDQIQGDIPYSWKRYDTSLKGLVIGNSCTRIPKFAFEGCTGLTGSLVIPDSVTYINDNAFAFCQGFDGRLTLSDNLLRIGYQAFRSNSSSQMIYTGELIVNAEILGGQCFYGLGITNLTIGEKLKTIEGNSNFSYCMNLTNANCYVTKDVIDQESAGMFELTSLSTFHVRSTDNTWTAGPNQTIGLKTGVLVIKDL